MGAARNVLGTIVGTGAVHAQALILGGTFGVGRLASAENGITGIVARTRENRADGAPAFGVRIAGDLVGAVVTAIAKNFNTEPAIAAFCMLTDTVTTTEDFGTFVIAKTWNGDASAFVCAYGVSGIGRSRRTPCGGRGRSDPCRTGFAGIGTRNGQDNAGVIDAICMGTAGDVITAIIGTFFIDSDTAVVIRAFGVNGTAAEDRVALVLTSTRENDADGIFTGSVLTAIDDRGTFVGTVLIESDALILGVANGAMDVATEDGITVIGVFTGKDDAGGVIGSAFGVLTAIDS